MRMNNFDQPSSSRSTRHKRIHPAMPEDSFRLIIAGLSGSGKTNTLLHMIYYLLHFDEILLFAKNLHQDKYQFLLSDFATRVDPEVGYQVIQTPSQFIPLEEAFQGNESQRLVIFDDFVCEKNQNETINYFINGRHPNCSVIYLSQCFFKVPKNIRYTSSHYCVFRFRPKENKRIADDLGVDPQNLDKATKEPFSFLFFDKPRKKELKNFDEAKMGFWNGQTTTGGSGAQARGARSPAGPRGLQGAGFKITANGNYDLENKRLTNVADATGQDDAVTKSQLDNKPDSTSVLLLNGQNHMTGDLDLQGNKLLPGEINMNRKLIKDLDTDESDDLSAVNMATLKTFSADTAADIDLQDKFNVKNSKQQSFFHLPANYDNLVSYNDAKNIFLSRKQTFAMKASLDMGNQTIFNVKDPTVADQGAQKIYVDAETAKNTTKVNQLTTSINAGFATAQNQRNQKADKTYVDTTFLKLSGGTMTGDIDIGGNKLTNLSDPSSSSEPATKSFVDQSHLSQSGYQKNEFLSYAGRERKFFRIEYHGSWNQQLYTISSYDKYESL